jgi:hypothetical protein
MSVPGEDYVLRLRWTNPAALTSNVLDLLAVSEDETVALVAWEAHDGAAFAQAGFSLIRFTSAGVIKWQSTHTLCEMPADCGQWVLRYGAIAVEGDRFVVIGTIVEWDKPGVFDSIGVGIDDGGKVVWVKRYQTTKSLCRAMGIVPLAKPGQFLVAAHNAQETDTWLFGIDTTGKLTGLEMRFLSKWVQRLRALPSQGIFVLGTNNDDSAHPLGWILNVDPATAKVAWERTYDPHDGTTLRWYAAAAGGDIVTVVGNTGVIGNPFIATLAGSGAPDVGNVRASFRPGPEEPAIFLYGIAHVPSSAPVWSICGTFDNAAWHIAIDDSVHLLWQKKYNHDDRSSATLTPIVFPNPSTVVTGGQAIVPGDPLRGLLVKSEVAIGTHAPLICGVETDAVFEPAALSSEQIESPFKDLAMHSGDVLVNQTPLIEVDGGCLP